MDRKLDLVEYAVLYAGSSQGIDTEVRRCRAFWIHSTFVLFAIAGRMNQRQFQMIEYLREENRVLREQLGERRLRLSDDQHRRLTARAKRLGWKALVELATTVTRRCCAGIGS